MEILWNTVLLFKSNFYGSFTFQGKKIFYLYFLNTTLFIVLDIVSNSVILGLILTQWHKRISKQIENERLIE